MEVEDMSGKVEWEARRVAAAFGVKEFELSFASDEDQTQLIYVGRSGNKEICWGVNLATSPRSINQKESLPHLCLRYTTIAN